MTSEIERKKHKVDYGHEMRTRLEEDRLSSLPDDIIHHILSFIDAKFAVQTCVLSSRWKFIWTFLSHLNLASRQFRILPKFSKFVNRVLSCRNNSTDVSTVDLDFRGRISQKFVEKVATYAFSHNVQKIKIDFQMPNDGDHFPHCLFGSESLKHLSLGTGSDMYNAIPCAQSPWNFPALTTLDLKNIWFCFDNTNSLDLFSKCVNLKNLTLDRCYARGLGVMQIFCPQLLNLNIRSGGISKIALSTPNLTSFYYRGHYVLSLSANGLHCLDTVNLELSMSNTESVEYRQKDAHRLFSLLQELKDTKNLRVYECLVEFLSTVPDMIEHQPSPFSNLKCLTIKFDQRRAFRDSTMIDHAIKFLVNSSSSGNVIMEIPEKLHLYQVGQHGAGVWLTSQKKNYQQLCNLADMLYSREIIDPRIRKGLENVKKKLASQCQELGLRPPLWSN